MPFPEWPVDGGCRCGKIRFRLFEAPLMEIACHCRGCQAMTASAFSTTVIMRDTGFAIVSGSTVIGGCHGKDAEHHHCGHCKSWVYTTTRLAPHSVNVRATLLDDPSWFAPWAETQLAEKLPWATTGARHGFERFPAADRFASLMTAYRAERGIRSDA